MMDSYEKPKHIAFIPDGNRRWAVQNNLSFRDGHRRGAENFIDILKYCSKINISYVTFYAFSSENWQRPLEEKRFLFLLLLKYLNQKKEDFIDQFNIRFIGDISTFSNSVRDSIKKIEQQQSTKKDVMHLQIALGYGGRDEIVRTVQKVYRAVERGEIAIEQVDVDFLSKNLDTADVPDPDLLIRSGGDQRISNFLLFQMAYTEFFFTPTLWPDFSTVELDNALVDFSKRYRRFGKKSIADHDFSFEMEKK